MHFFLKKTTSNEFPFNLKSIIKNHFEPSIKVVRFF